MHAAVSAAVPSFPTLNHHPIQLLQHTLAAEHSSHSLHTLPHAPCPHETLLMRPPYL
jgi:hypothetical protein